MVATTRLQITFSALCWNTNAWAQCLQTARTTLRDATR